MVDRKKIIEIFKHSPTPTSILQPKDGAYTYVQVNNSYCEMTQTDADDLIGFGLFEKFPANPDEEEPQGPSRLLSSFEKVLETKETDEIHTIRYDIMLDENVFNEIYWKVINTPVLDDEGNVEYIINSATPKTEQVLSERARNLMLNNTEDSFVYLDLTLSIIDYNTKFFLIYKDIFDKEIKRGTNILEHVPPEREKELIQLYKSVLSGETIEYNTVFNDPTEGKRYFTVNNKPAIDEGSIVGVFISMLEKTEEQIARLELKKNETRFRALVENGSDVLLIMDTDGNTEYASPSIKNILGYSPEEVLKMEIYNKIHPDDLYPLQTKIAECLNLSGEPVLVKPVRLKDKNGNWRWFDGSITNMLHEPSIEGLVYNFREITERIEAEQRIIESKEKYQSLIGTIDGVIWEAEPDSMQITYISEQSRTMFGYEPDQWVKSDKFWMQKLHPEDRDATVEKYQKEVEARRNHELEYRLKKNDGQYAWIRDLITVVTDDGKPTKVRGLMMNISEEKDLQTKLADAYRLSKIGTWELDLVNEKLNWSKFVKELHEVDADYKPDLESAINFYKEGWSKDRIKKIVDTAINEQTSFDEELLIVTAKNNEKWIRAVGQPDIVDGKCIRIYGSTQDITDRKTTEIKLKRSNEALTERIKEQRCLYRISNLDENNLKIDELLLKAVKIIPKGWYLPDHVQVRLNWNGTEYNSPAFKDIGSKHVITDQITNERSNLQITIGYPESEDLPLNVQILKEEKDLLKAIIHQLFQKIDQIQKQEELNSVQQKYKNVVEYSTNMFYHHDTNGVLTYVSPQSSWFLGYPPEKAKIKWTEFTTDHPLNAIGEKRTHRAIETGEVQEPYELQLKTSDDRLIWVEVNEAPIKQDGEVVGVVGSLTDITDRKLVEDDLKASLERFEFVKKATRDAIYDWDIVNDNLIWGDGFMSLFGHNPQTHQKISEWKQHVHPEDVESVKHDLDFTLKDSSMNQWTIEYRYKSDNGSFANVIENGYIVRNEDGVALRMIGSLRDITEQKQTEEELKASLKEKETLLAEIHHRVKNNLAVVSGMMQLQAFESHNASVQEQLYDSVVRIKTMATVHELLYQSNSFSQLDFSDTLLKLVQNITDTLQSENEVDVKFNSVPVNLNINQAIPASLIVNEVITNAFKHAFVGIKECMITIELKQEGEKISITILDNGVGMPVNISSSSESSLGFHLIDLLSEQVNADTVYQKNKNGSGTIFKLTFEKQDNKKGIGSSSLT
ncbi:MAG: PAS domain S-box protein [Gracilimonas sp.]|nr:PAS domain S-box protein [Gracilimonas sp.]